MNMRVEFARTLILNGTFALLSACAATPATDPRDPYENYNRKVQSFNDGLDDYLMKPAAEAYRSVTPDFANRGISNFFSNVDDIGVIANEALQGSFSQSGLDGARLLINSTVGLAGFVDVATMLDFPKHEESFDKTLAIWGVETGPYLVLPVLGPSSVRGLGSAVGDAALNPVTYLGLPVAASMGSGALSAVDKRADHLAIEKIASEAAIDRYDFFKNAFLSHRRYAVEVGDLREDDPLESADSDDSQTKEAGN
ncbi:VacJ family lipoprotein [Methylomonas sp. LWB]|uniref:MlaA family lipoprotein n=1 Tax=Methylomonas sp. LWB TaxID=1905845 RepID=UPI000A5C7F18|nr:VacJ family lipoprotein [Methylomonas sp. LWB]